MSERKQRPLLRVLAVAAMTLGVSGFSLGQDGGPGRQDGPGDGNGEQQRRPRRQNAENADNKPGQERGPRGGRQGGPGGEMRRLVRALDGLALTDAQKPQVEALKAETREQMMELRDLPPEEARQRVQDIVGDAREKLGEILTAEQKAQLKKNLAAAATQPAGPRGRGPGGDADGRGPQAQDGDERRPRQQAGEGRQGQQQGGGRGIALQRLKQNLSQLELSGEQKTKTDEIVAWAEECVAKMREDTQADPQQLREHAMNVMRDVQRKLSDVLTPEQQAKMRELQPRRGQALGQDGPGDGNDDRPRRPRGDGPPPGDMNGDGPPPPGGPDGDRPPPPPRPDDQRTQNDSQNDSAPAKAGSVSSTASRAADASSPSTPPNAPKLAAVGQPAPAFTLLSLDRKTVTAASLRGRPTVLVFGSYSSPLFRDKAPGFEKLRQKYRGRANVVFVYTREAYAAGEWDVERNKDAKVEVAQPATLDDRRALARQTRDAFKLECDVLVDDIDDAVATAYAADAGGCTILDAEGNVVAQQKWAEPFAAKLALDELLKR